MVIDRAIGERPAGGFLSLFIVIRQAFFKVRLSITKLTEEQVGKFGLFQ
jgi:hypothetical protein